MGSGAPTGPAVPCIACENNTAPSQNLKLVLVCNFAIRTCRETRDYICQRCKTATLSLHPANPSWCTIFGSPSDKPLAKPGTVCTLTFTASSGHSLRVHHIDLQSCLEHECKLLSGRPSGCAHRRRHASLLPGDCTSSAPEMHVQSPKPIYGLVLAVDSCPPDVRQELGRRRRRQIRQRVGPCDLAVLPVARQETVW